MMKESSKLARNRDRDVSRRSLWVTLMFKLSQNIRHHVIGDYLTRCACATYIFHFVHTWHFFVSSLLTVLCASIDSNKLPVASTAMMCSISMTSPSLGASGTQNRVLLAQALNARKVQLLLYLTICLTGFWGFARVEFKQQISSRSDPLVWIQY